MLAGACNRMVCPIHGTHSGVSPETVRTVDYEKLKVLQTFEIARLTRFAAPTATITLDFGNGDDG